ncbi:hypothetical protein BTA51_19855 [Hahella sp. CCB-MM4]|uniref:hypothetical protein n=1 Tax=Hahella sp. (strain CCB-MM4) TaxID=1926491 RepID=UPI000B9C407D|nr:hypothetical protein [Hahella sp. CCB-MM4]OZG71542.1 hypothetical protein BTA51_19855 [Hahella sp. CCB-MM4]
MMRDAVATLPLLDLGFKTLLTALLVTCMLVGLVYSLRAHETGQSMFAVAKPTDHRLVLPFKPLPPEQLTADFVQDRHIPQG